MQLQLSGFLIDHRAEQPAVGPGHFCKWRDGVIVPVICPTCQNVFAGPVKTSMLAAKSYFAWGCFRYFSLEGAGTPSRSSRLRPPSPNWASARQPSLASRAKAGIAGSTAAL
jgi:hypothetical protein